MMRSHHGAMLVLVFLLCAGMMTSGHTRIAGAQDVPIESVGESTSDAELVVDGARYLRDRDVLVNVNPLQEIADENGNPVYQKPGNSDPIGAVYVLSADTEGEATRYLPEMVGNASAVCPAELVAAGTLQGDGANYAAVGPETDMSADQLTEIGSTEAGATIYAYSPDQPLGEILVAESQGQGNVPLVRYMRIDENAVPVAFAEDMTFAGQEFVPTPGAVTSLDGLVKVGCAGLFPAWAPSSDQPFQTVTLQVAGQVVSFEATTQDQADVPAEEVSTPAATPTESVEEATVAPTDVPTEVPPTATEVPPTATEVPPTATEIPPTATEIPPTATATEIPPTATEVPATEAPPTATEVPPTEAPTTATATEAAPTQAPLAAPTATVDSAEADDQDDALPTEVPPTPAPGTPESTLPPARPTPTQAPLQPQAVVPTLPADAPSPPASRTIGIQCTGTVGEEGANGLPERLPQTVQYAGAGYRYSGTVARADVGELTAVGCAGPFVISTLADDQTAIFLSSGDAQEQLFQFGRTESFTVSSQVSEQPRTIQTTSTDDQPAVTYRASGQLVPSVYSSVSLILYVEDAEAVTPDRILGYAVGSDLFGVYVPEGAGEPAPQEVRDRAEAAGIHGELRLSGQRYILTSLWTPFGTTSNGWLTLYGPEGDAAPEELVGIDPRQQHITLFEQRD
jgi:hypothetical protein